MSDPSHEESGASSTTPPAELVDETAGLSDQLSAPDEEREPSPFDVSIEQYEGPLDLLLDLIKKHRVDVLDIPIAKITDQYLQYVRRAEELNVELSAEFVLMAAILIQIKSKMLLPTDPAIPGEEPEDPREELVRQLLDREQFMQAAQMLKHKRLIEENVWSAAPAENFSSESDGPPGLAVTLFDLVQTFEEVLERFKNRPTLELEQDEVSVAGRIGYLRNLLMSADGPISVRDVFMRQESRRALVATFLAVLEMVKMQAIELRQPEIFGDIAIEKHKMFDAAFSGDGPLLDAEAEYRS